MIDVFFNCSPSTSFAIGLFIVNVEISSIWFFPFWETFPTNICNSRISVRFRSSIILHLFQLFPSRTQNQFRNRIPGMESKWNWMEFYEIPRTPSNFGIEWSTVCFDYHPVCDRINCAAEFWTLIGAEFGSSYMLCNLFVVLWGLLIWFPWYGHHLRRLVSDFFSSAKPYSWIEAFKCSIMECSKLQLLNHAIVEISSIQVF